MTRSKIRPALAAVAATAMLLAGCGGGDETTDTTDAAATADTAEETPAETTATETEVATTETATATATETATETASEGEDLGTEITEITDLAIFADLLQQYGVDETLTEGGPYTVFAPVDTAFDVELGTGVEDLQQMPEEEVTQLLRAHVIEGEVTPEQLTPDSTLTNLNGDELQVGEGDGGNLTVGSAELTTDVPVRAANGNLYTVGAVIQP